MEGKTTTPTKPVLILLLISALIVLYLLFQNLKDDYYYFYTKKETIAFVRDYQTFKDAPDELTISFYNEYFQKTSKCIFEIDPYFSRKLSNDLPKELQVVYTSQSPCDCYLLDYKRPGIGYLVIHIALTAFSLLGVFLFARGLLKKES